MEETDLQDTSGVVAGAGLGLEFFLGLFNGHARLLILELLLCLALLRLSPHPFQNEDGRFFCGFYSRCQSQRSSERRSSARSSATALTKKLSLPLRLRLPAPDTLPPSERLARERDE